VAGCCECGDEPSGSGAMELDTGYYKLIYFLYSKGFGRNQNSLLVCCFT
jgi:hypothetical protein